ncbi:MAG: SusC/RagA family TonB-linked outer membrane protein [Candidatus Cyclobacteriaceae bacterium M3_2C_046]
MKIKLLRYIIMVTKFTFYGFLIQFCMFSFLLAADASGQEFQSIKEVTLSINLKNASVEGVFKAIEAKTNFIFQYDSKIIDPDLRLNLYGRKNSIADYLLQVSEKAKLHFKQLNNSISVSKIPFKPNTTNEFEIIIQTRLVTGKVTAYEDGEGLPGVNVIEKGTTNGVVTNVNGAYSLEVAENAVLVFSSVGYTTEEIQLENRSVVDIVMTQDIKQLQELVVVGYSTQKKVNLTGSVGTIQAEEIENRPVQNVTQMLQGLIPGLNISQSSGGNLDASPSINIRGTATIGQGSTGGPLVLIDGMAGDINSLNPQDIDNISVLKDAAASSIYGSRAPFGVILITTKSGTAGKTRVSYTNNFRINSPLYMPQMTDSYTFATYFNDANTNAGSGAFFSESRLQRIRDFKEGKLSTTTIPNPNNPRFWNGYSVGNDNINWYETIFRDQASSQEHNLSVSGGNDKMQYFVSGNYLGQNGLMVYNQDKYKRYSANIKLTTELTDWVALTLNNRFIRNEFARPSRLTSSLFRDLARQGWPVLPLYDPNGYMFSSPSPALGLRDGGRDENQRDLLYQQLQLVFEPIAEWKTSAEFNYRTRNDFRHWDILETYNHDVEGNPYVYDKGSHIYEYAFREQYFNTNIYSEYSKNLMGGHNLTVLLGFQSELNKYRDLSARRDGIIIPDLPVLDVTSGTDSNGETVPPNVSGEYQNWATSGFFGRINYNYKERYLLETNLRYDGTSRFRSEKRWNWFPSVSLGWNIAQENFWQPLQDKVQMLKLRASYGALGNQNTSDWYPTYVLMPVGIGNGNWLINGAKPNTSFAPGLVSESLTWEKVESYNLGLDISLFDDRLQSSFDYYRRYTYDMVGPAPELPVILGTDVPKINNTDLLTYGFEFDIFWRDNIRDDLGYSLRLLLSDAQTEILEYPNPTGSLNTYRTGQMLGEIWGYNTIGLAKTQEDMDSHLASLPEGGQDALGNRWEAGDVKYEDLNNDGKIDQGANTLDDHGDLRIIGNDMPRYRLSFNLGANYKGFDFSAFLQGVMKRDYFQDSYYFWGAYRNGMWWSTAFEEHMDYFRDDPDHPLGQNIDAYYPRPLFSGAAKNQQNQTRYLQDASYIRLKNLQIGYTLPDKLSQKLRLNKLRIYLSGENLFTLTGMTSIFDPETIEGGYGGNVYPLSRIYSAGLNVNF